MALNKLRRSPAFRQVGGRLKIGNLPQVEKDFLDHRRVFSATAPALLYVLHGPGQPLDRFPVSPSPCSRIHAITLTKPPHSLQVSISILNTRFSLFAQSLPRT
jgi:hypothetical protein